MFDFPTLEFKCLFGTMTIVILLEGYTVNDKVKGEEGGTVGTNDYFGLFEVFVRMVGASGRSAHETWFSALERCSRECRQGVAINGSFGLRTEALYALLGINLVSKFNLEVGGPHLFKGHVGIVEFHGPGCFNFNGSPSQFLCQTEAAETETTAFIFLGFGKGT